MSINLRQSSSANGARNTFTQTVNFVTDYGGNGNGVTSNASAVSAFNTAYAAFTGRTQLIIPPGTYVGGDVLGALGGTGLVISAYGARIKDFSIVQGGQQGGFTSQANLVTTAAGNATVPLVTGAETSRFSSGRWVQVTEGDVQGGGDPTNPWKFEYKKIANIGSGTLTFTEPLQKSYSSTYPNYAPGNPGTYGGGPATAYCLTANWDQEIELKGAYIIDNGNLFYGKCRSIRYTDCTFETYGPCPTQNLLCVIDRCTTLGTELEVDKLVETLIIRNSSFNAIVFQNSAVNNLIADNITIAPGQYWRGVAGGNSVITNLSTPTFWFGVKGYGVVTGNTKLISCNATTASYDTSYRFLLSDYGQPGSGALTITSASPQRWAIPTGYCVIVDGSGNWSGITFQVTNIAFSGGVTTISTTLSTPVPGTAGGFSAPWYIVPHPGKDTTLINCTGNSVFTTASANPANSPIFGWS